MKRKLFRKNVKKTWIVPAMDKFIRIFTAKEIADWKREDEFSGNLRKIKLAPC